RLRLEQDRWLLAEPAMRAYRQSAQPYIRALERARHDLEDIKLMAGPAPANLRPLAVRLDRNARRLALLEPPAPVLSAHEVFRSAYALAENAVKLRRDAVEHADLDLARQASAAAAGALMLFERA